MAEITSLYVWPIGIPENTRCTLRMISQTVVGPRAHTHADTGMPDRQAQGQIKRVQVTHCPIDSSKSQVAYLFTTECK